jgi:hypothetical protein
VSYYVIKGPEDGGAYLGPQGKYECPQWGNREAALKFQDSESAWKFIRHWNAKHRDRYLARVVRVNTVRDLKAHIAQLRTWVDDLRLELAAAKATAREGTGGEDG